MTAVQLFCLPCSGASAMVYARWKRRLPEGVKLKPLDLPGRGARMDEPALTEMATLVLQLTRECVSVSLDPARPRVASLSLKAESSERLCFSHPPYNNEFDLTSRRAIASERAAVHAQLIRGECSA